MREKRGFPEGLIQKSGKFIIKLTRNPGGQLQKSWYPQQGEEVYKILFYEFLSIFLNPAEYRRVVVISRISITLSTGFETDLTKLNSHETLKDHEFESHFSPEARVDHT